MPGATCFDKHNWVSSNLLVAEDLRRPSGFFKKLLLTAVSVAFCLILLGIGELFCRAFLDINLRKTSKDFMFLDAAGRPVANAPNSQGVSFGAAVFSDSNGFRVPENYRYPEVQRAILLLGDSVTFGVGVPEEKTFAGLLRSSDQSSAVYNAAVNGFSLPDYLRTAERALSDHPEIDEVILFYCLNDFREIGQSEEKPASASGLAGVKRMIASAFAGMNEFLGPRSKLYVLITGLTTDPSRRYFEWDLSLMDAASGRSKEILEPIAKIHELVKQRNGRFAVFLNPYEFQMRQEGGDFSPQDRIIEYLRAKDIRYIDTRDAFRQLPRPSSAFLFADPMHLSESGHRVVYDQLTEFRRQERTN